MISDRITSDKTTFVVYNIFVVFTHDKSMNRRL